MGNDILQGKIGGIGIYDFKFENGAAQFVISVSKKVGPLNLSGSINASCGAEELGVFIKGLIPGGIDDAIIDLILAALKK